jgi:hypothetical protein
MADVSVEFGAKDTGLEQTLKTVQAQLTSLEDEVKSGTLSFDELQQTMRKIAQAEKVEAQLQAMAEGMTDAGDAASGAAPQIDDSADSMDEVGDSATDAGEKSEMGFLQMAAAVAAGQAAVELAMGAIKKSIDGVVGMFDKFGQALDKGAQLDVLSSRTGVASGELSRLGRALENTGASADMLGPVFDRMNRALADSGEDGGKAGQALAKLGINIEHLKTLSPDQQFELIGKSLSNVADRSERVDMAMDIFGRGSGSRLLRLFNDYEGTMAQVDRQLGTFPSIMDAMSASFESASTEINAAKEKMVEFATGILSRVMPAIESIAMGLASIDAAALGQKLADAFTGGIEAMQGFQSAIDSIKLGSIEDALALLWQSIKVQAMMTGDEIYKRLQAGFSAAWEFVKDIFAPEGMVVKYIIHAFAIVGAKITEMLGNAVLAFIDALPPMLVKLNPLFGAIANSIRTTVNKASEDAQDIWGAMYHDVGYVGAQITGAASRISENFNTALGDANSLFAGTNAEAEKLAQMQEEIAKKVAELPPKLEEANDAAGRLGQNSFLFAQNIQSGSNAASNARSSLDALAGSAGSLKTETGGAADNLQTVGERADEIAQKKMDQGAKDLNAEIRALGEEYAKLMAALGIEKKPNISLNDIMNDLGLVNNAFDSTETKIEQVTRALAALNNTAVEDLTPIIDDIGASSKITRIGQYLRDNFKGLDATPFIDRDKATRDAKDTKVAIDAALGEFKAVVRLEPQIQQDINDIKNTLATELADPTKVALEGEDDIKQVRESAESNFAQPISLNLEGDETIDAARQFAESTFGETIPMQLNADESISQIREDLKEQIDVAIQSSKGTEHLSSIDKLVEKIENLVTKIERKLPLQALA